MRNGYGKDAKEIAAQNVLYVEELVRFEPQAVRAGCEEWAREHKGWPELSELLEVVRGHATPALPAAKPGETWPTGEHFADRCNRLGITDAEMTQVGLSGCKTIFDGHCSAAGITDEQFVEGWRQIRRGEKVDLRAREKARRLPQQMAENDRLAADIEAHPERYFQPELMLSLYRQMVVRRQDTAEAA